MDFHFCNYFYYIIIDNRLFKKRLAVYQLLTNKNMTIKNLKEYIKNLPDNTIFKVACDEELNIVFNGWEIIKTEKNELIICGLSGFEDKDFTFY